MTAAANPYAALEEQLRGTAFSRIRYVEQTASTNEDAAALLGTPESYGLTIVAEHQTAGAGRKGRQWVAAPETSLLFTSILPRAMATRDLWVVPFGVALAVRRALKAHGVNAKLHWPNDLLVDGKKIAGILCTSRIAGDSAFVAAGIGINVLRAPGADEAITPPPAFVSDSNPEADRVALLRDVLLNFEVWHEHLDVPQRIARVWERTAGLPGAAYRIALDDGTPAFDATAISLATGGGLIVDVAGEGRRTIALADARALR